MLGCSHILVKVRAGNEEVDELLLEGERSRGSGEGNFLTVKRGSHIFLSFCRGGLWFKYTQGMINVQLVPVFF